MGFRDAAARGRRIREEKARGRGTAPVVAIDSLDERRLARMYGVDPDARGFATYLGVMTIVLGGIGVAATWWSGNGDALPVIAACVGLVGLGSVAAYLFDERARRAMVTARAELRALPYSFDAEDYERVATEFDHSTGWARISIQFEAAPLSLRPELRQDIADAMTGFGAEASRWVTPTRLWVRGASAETSISTKHSHYTTSRPIHEWIVPLLARDLRDLHATAPVVEVAVRFGFFEDGSFTVGDENEPEP